MSSVMTSCTFCVVKIELPSQFPQRSRQRLVETNMQLGFHVWPFPQQTCYPLLSSIQDQVCLCIDGMLFHELPSNLIVQVLVKENRCPAICLTIGTPWSHKSIQNPIHVNGPTLHRPQEICHTIIQTFVNCFGSSFHEQIPLRFCEIQKGSNMTLLELLLNCFI